MCEEHKQNILSVFFRKRSPDNYMLYMFDVNSLYGSWHCREYIFIGMYSHNFCFTQTADLDV